MTDVLFVFVVAIMSLFVSITVHEFGHLIVGLAHGFRFYLLIVGPIKLMRTDGGRIKLGFEKNAALWGGAGAVMPRDEDADNFRRFSRILLGGPVASLIFGALCLWPAISAGDLALLLLGAVPLGLGVASLIPLRAGAFYTDGGRWLRMHGTEETRNVELAIWNITQRAIVGGNYGKTRQQELSALLRDKDARTRYIGHCFAYYFYRDSGDSENAEREKAELRALMPEVSKQTIAMFPIN